MPATDGILQLPREPPTPIRPLDPRMPECHLHSDCFRRIHGFWNCYLRPSLTPKRQSLNPNSVRTELHAHHAHNPELQLSSIQAVDESPQNDFADWTGLRLQKPNSPISLLPEPAMRFGPPSLVLEQLCHELGDTFLVLHFVRSRTQLWRVSLLDQVQSLSDPSPPPTTDLPLGSCSHAGLQPPAGRRRAQRESAILPGRDRSPAAASRASTPTAG